MRRSTVREYAMAVGERHRKADRSQMGKVPDEFVATAGYHGRSTIRLPRHAGALAQVYDRLNPVTLRAHIDRALQRLWTFADNP